MEPRRRALEWAGRARTKAWLAYGAAVAGTAVATLARWAIGEWVGEVPPFITFYPVVIAVAVFAGTGPGIVAAILGGLAADFFFIPPIGTLWPLAPGHLLGMGLFVAINLAMSVVGGRLRRAHQAIRSSELIYRAMARSIPEGAMSVVDSHLRYQAVEGDSLLSRLGLNARQMVGRTVQEVFQGDTGLVRAEHFRRAFQGEVTSYETEYQGRWVWSQFVPLRDEAGQVSAAMSLGMDITERKQAEDGLQAAKERIETILASITDCFFALDRELRFTYANAEAQRVLRKSSAELLGGELAELFPHAEAFSAHYAQVLASGRPAHFEAFYGPLQIWFEVHAYPSPEGISVYFRDVTERKHAEEALRASEHFNRSLIESSLDCIKTLDLEGNLLSMSAGGQQLLEIGDLAPYLNASWIDFWQEEDRPRVRQAIAAARDGGTGRFQAFCRTARGTPKWWDVIITPILDPHGPVGSLLSVSRDITEQKQAEEVIKRRNCHLQLLHQASARLLVGQHPVELLRQLHPQIAQAFGADAFMLYQAEHGNDQLRLLACAGVSDEQRQRLETLRYGRAICADPAEALQPMIATHVQEREAPNWRFIRKLGFRSYLYYPLIFNHHLHGTIAFASRTRDEYDRTDLEFFHTIAGTLAEALDRQRLEAELQRHAAELEATVQERTAKLQETIAELEGFSYSLIHDMRAPLRAMQSYAGIVLEEAGPRLRPAETELLSRIRVAVSRMDHLITDSLSYSKILRQELPLVPVNLGRLLRSMVETYPNFHPPQADIAIELGDLSVRGNEAALTQVFSHLLGNAVKFVAPGVRPRVRIWAQQPEQRINGLVDKWVNGGEVSNRESSGHLSTHPPIHQSNQMVRICIEDNGIGIPPGAHQKIFGMFQRMHREDEYAGTGIGLAIVRKAMERLAGRVGLQSEPGKGSTFWVELPTAAQSPSQLPMQEAA